MPNQTRNFQNHLTIIVGPPNQKAIDQNIGNWTNNANDTIDNLWIEHVSSYVDLLTEHRAPEYISELERIFTHLLSMFTHFLHIFMHFILSVSYTHLTLPTKRIV